MPSEEGDPGMDDERFLNSYHNASSSPGPDVPADLAGFILAAAPVLGEAAELSRGLAHAHQDEASVVRLASLTATALDALAQVHRPEYRGQGRRSGAMIRRPTA